MADRRHARRAPFGVRLPEDRPRGASRVDRTWPAWPLHVRVRGAATRWRLPHEARAPCTSTDRAGAGNAARGEPFMIFRRKPAAHRAAWGELILPTPLRAGSCVTGRVKVENVGSET